MKCAKCGFTTEKEDDKFEICPQCGERKDGDGNNEAGLPRLVVKTLGIVIGIVVIFAIEIISRSRASNFVKACRALGLENDPVKAKSLFELAANDGNPEAQFVVGYCLLTGFGCNPSISQTNDFSRVRQAVNWWYAAATNGNAYAQYNLGRCFYHGIGVKRDISKAIKLWMCAARQGDIEALYNLGCCYFQGNGVREDSVLAEACWNRAAEKGCEQAIFNLSCSDSEIMGDNFSFWLPAVIVNLPPRMGRADYRGLIHELGLMDMRDVNLAFVPFHCKETFVDGEVDVNQFPQISVRKSYVNYDEMSEEQKKKFWSKVTGAEPTNSTCISYHRTTNTFVQKRERVDRLMDGLMQGSETDENALLFLLARDGPNCKESDSPDSMFRTRIEFENGRAVVRRYPILVLEEDGNDIDTNRINEVGEWGEFTINNDRLKWIGTDSPKTILSGCDEVAPATAVDNLK